MDAQRLLSACEGAGIDFFTGVPDSQLKGLCDSLYALYGVHSPRHIVAANEGNAVGLAAGHFLATGRPALCYMQNSGLGNAVNPLASLMDAQVYQLPCLLVVGWRGEPGVHDEPQHVKQGQITLSQLEILGVPYRILSKDTTEEQFAADFAFLREQLNQRQCAAIVVRKGALTCSLKPAYGNENTLTRERAAEIMLNAMDAGDVVVSTTGKLSREIFELREKRGEGHERDFLTVGSMGHASMIALEIALEKPNRRVWCLDGDGAALMHLGALPVIAQRKPANLIHVVINNAAHETVGGMPVCEGGLCAAKVASAVGYPRVLNARDEATLEAALQEAKRANQLTMLEVACAVGARADLGRPTTTPIQNRDALMAFLRGGKGMIALLLNSGLGSRMGDETREHPKCMCRLTEQETIISWQVKLLRRIGVTEAVVTTGHLADTLIAYLESLDSGIRFHFVHNPKYRETNYIYSMYLARNLLRGQDVISLHGDLVLHPTVMDALAASGRSVMAVDSTQPLPDKDFKALIQDGRIRRVGVDCFDAGSVECQAAYHWQAADFSSWMDEIERFVERGDVKCYAENAFNAVSGEIPLYPLECGGRLCAEIDNQADREVVLTRFRQEVL